MTTTSNRTSRTSLQVWRAFSLRLGAIALSSVGAAAALIPYSLTPDGRDPFYIAVAWQFVIWGLIDLAFAANGLRDIRILRSLPEDERTVRTIEKTEGILAALRFNRWLNAVWLVAGVSLLAAGYAKWSPTLAGHGVGVIVQTVLLIGFDRAFHRSLKLAADRSDFIKP